MGKLGARRRFIHPQKGAFLTKASPIMLNPEKATECARRLQWHYLTNEQAEEALEDAVMFPKENGLPTDEFANIELTAYAFGEVAKDYGLFLRGELGIGIMLIRLASLEDKPFAAQLWFSDLLLGRSELDGVPSGIVMFGWFLSNHCRLRGIKYAGAQKPLDKILNKMYRT